MPLTADGIQQVVNDVRTYEAANYGSKGGKDFVQVVNTFMQSPVGKSTCISFALKMMLTFIIDPPQGEDGVRSMVDGNDNPFRALIADLFYLGYRVGHQQAEIDHLERMRGGRA